MLDDVPVQSRLIIELANYEVPRSENSTPPNQGIYFWGSGTRVKFLHTQFQLYVTDSFILVYTSTIFFLGYILSGEIQCMHACMHRWLHHLQVPLHEKRTGDYLYGDIQEYTCWHGKWYISCDTVLLVC